MPGLNTREVRLPLENQFSGLASAQVARLVMHEAPNLKPQISNKLQFPNPKPDLNCGMFEIWPLGFLWDLRLGIW